MTALKTLIKPTILTFLLYIALTVALSIVLNIIWQAGLDTPSTDHQELAEMAAGSTFIQVGSMLIGVISAMLCAFIVTRKTQAANYRMALCFATTLILYGLVSIVLHPADALAHQVGKVLLPVPLCLAGAWIGFKTSGLKAL